MVIFNSFLLVYQRVNSSWLMSLGIVAPQEMSSLDVGWLMGHRGSPVITKRFQYQVLVS